MMIHDPSSAACAGSLTPQLEGAARSDPHPTRIRQVSTPSQTEKGGIRHE